MSQESNRMDWSEVLSRNFNMMASFNDRIWEMWSVGLGRFAWMNEQYDNVTQMMMERNKSMREELIRSAEQLSGEVKNNMGMIEQMVEDFSMSTAKSMSNMPSMPNLPKMPSIPSISELSAQSPFSQLPFSQGFFNFWDLTKQMSGADKSSDKGAKDKRSVPTDS